MCYHFNIYSSLCNVSFSPIFLSLILSNLIMMWHDVVFFLYFLYLGWLHLQVYSFQQLLSIISLNIFLLYFSPPCPLEIPVIYTNLIVSQLTDALFFLGFFSVFLYLCVSFWIVSKTMSSVSLIFSFHLLWIPSSIFFSYQKFYFFTTKGLV